MHVFLEDTSSRHSDSTIHTLSWMNDACEDGGDSEDRQTNSQRGWLACGTARNVVGVTLTDCSNSEEQTSERANFNLRGHRDTVIMVRWNEVYQKLATCDVNGVIFVWIKHNDRWSIELINDRNIQVTDFCWSCDGRLALICYRDGFVLVGSVAGRRLWSSSLRLENAVVTCSSWTPAGQKVMFGTSTGRIVVLNWQGEVLSHLTLQPAKPISRLLWSSFIRSTDWDAVVAGEMNANRTAPDDPPSTLVICFKDDVFHLLCSYDDLSPRVVSTGLSGLQMEWSNNGELLAVGGFVRLSNHECRNEVQFYSKTGEQCYKLSLAHQSGTVQTSRLTTLTWGHADQRLFISVGCHVYTARVSQCIPSIESLSLHCVKQRLPDRQRLDELHLPAKLRTDIASMFLSTIKGYIPDADTLRQFVCVAPSGDKRLYCSMIQSGDDHYGGHFTLCLEYLGGLLPLLKARRTSKIRPEFVIFDPNANVDDDVKDDKDISNDSLNGGCEKSVFDSCASPRTHRRKRQRQAQQEENEASAVRPADNDAILCNGALPESRALVEVTSNFWGTRFSIHGAAARFLPADLGEIIYKTSLLHLQPRKMCLQIRHLRSTTGQCNVQPGVTTRNESGHFAGRRADFGEDGCEDDGFGRPVTLSRSEVDAMASPMASRPQHIVADVFTTPEDCSRRAAVISPTNASPAPLRLCGALPNHLTTTTNELSNEAISSNWAIKACNDISYIDVDSGEWPDTPDRACDVVRDVSQSGSSCPGAAQPFCAVFPTLNACSRHASATSLPDLLTDDSAQTNHASQSLPNSPKHTPSKTKKRRLRLWRKKEGLVYEPQQSPLGVTNSGGGSYNGLEAFQKAQLSKKLQRVKRWPDTDTNDGGEPSDGAYVLMHNKTPQWNDISQVYQLDFGGRVTQESAKNFQVEFEGKQVLQFGRIESSAYTLDFEQPFSAVQAFAVALANVTQRLK